MTRLIFELSMPSNNSWNGKWSGEGKKYTVSKTVTEKKAKTLEGSYYHRFSDGWVACVMVRKAKPREKPTSEFCGYEWMIRDILKKSAIG